MLFFLLIIRVPVAMPMLIVGFVGTAIMNEITPALAALSGETIEITTFFPLHVIPLFVLMGNMAGVSGMSRDLYDAAYAWFGHLRGGLASATIAGCAGVCHAQRLLHHLGGDHGPGRPARNEAL